MSKAKMARWSREWKEWRQVRYGGWPQEQNDGCFGRRWFWHYIQYGTEYSRPMGQGVRGPSWARMTELERNMHAD